MSGWVAGSIGPCVPTAADPHCRPSDEPGLCLGLKGSARCRRGPAWTRSPGSGGPGDGERGGLLRPGKSLCSFSGKAEEAERGRHPGALKRARW